ncbi:MAG TPA: DinB family protein [Bryobacteraceae bacterium]|nr:DinB family protein [Bryobacteraceae bacterium]
MSARVTLTILSTALTLCAADTLNQHDREFAMSDLHASRKLFLDSVAGLTPEQWNFKSAPDRWSIAECAEHIALAEDLIGDLVRNQIMKSPADPSKREEVKGKDELILKTIEDRSEKFKAPEVIVPKHKWSDPAEIVAHFKESRDRNIDYIDKTQDDLRDHFGKHPVMGTLDGYQFFLLMSAHTVRHTAQIMEVKSDPKFPK